MTSITFTLYSDLPYQEDSAEVPPRNALEPTSIINTYTVTPQRESFFTQFKVKEDYLSLYKAQYLKAEITTSTGNIIIYGWVDGVSMVSDSDTPLTTIDWHIDLWRSYINDVHVGYGLVTRRKVRYGEELDSPPLNQLTQDFNVIRWTADPYTNHIVNFSDNAYEQGFAWCIMMFASDEGPAELIHTRIRTISFPITLGNVSENCYVKSNRVPDGMQCPSFGQVIRGEVADYYSIASESVIACFLSPVRPGGSGVTRSGTTFNFGNDTDNVDGRLQVIPITGGNGKGAYLHTSLKFASYEATFGPEHALLVPQDYRRYVLTDMRGDIVGELPIGSYHRNAMVRTEVSPTSAYIKFQFDGVNSIANNVEMNIPLTPVGIVSNSWSDYVYSGQRDYDITSKKLAREEALVNTVTGGINAFASNALLANISTSASQAVMVRPESMPTRADRLLEAEARTNAINTSNRSARLRSLGAASLLTTGATIASASLEYFMGRYYDGQLQSATDTLMARQPDNLVSDGSSLDWVWYGQPITMKALRPDTYSEIQRERQEQFTGVAVSEHTYNCDTLLDAGGPIQIQQAVVTGDVPYQALHYIRQRLAAGVRMIEKVIE